MTEYHSKSEMRRIERMKASECQCQDFGDSYTICKLHEPTYGEPQLITVDLDTIVDMYKNSENL